MTYDLAGKQPAIPFGSLVLVTGVTGLIGGHVANEFLRAGYNVRGTTRRASKAQWSVDYFTKQYGPGRYEVVEVSDLSKPENFNDALKGVSGVAHVASDLSFDPDVEKVVPPIVNGVKALMEAAASVKSVKRFVLTSSSTALTGPKPGEKIKITLDTWNEEDVKAAYGPRLIEPSRGKLVYAASKCLGEKAAWAFVREKKPDFVFSAILPNANFGPLLDAQQNASTAGAVTSILKTGSLENSRAFLPPQWFVDVEDTAKLHLAAVIDPDVKDQRIIAFAEPFNWSQIAGILKHLYPKTQWPAPIPDEPRDLMEIPNENGVALLRKFGQDGFRPLDESLKRTLGDLPES